MSEQNAAINLIAEPVVAKLHENIETLFSPDALAVLCPGIPAPFVSLDLETPEPKPLHVFTWSTVREFSVAKELTGHLFNIGFHVWVTLVATASTPEEAARIANSYQAVALQMTLADLTLDGVAYELMVPQVKESDAWADHDGRRHAGYLLDYEAHVLVGASDAVKAILRSKKENSHE